MSFLDHFKPWKVVAEMKFSTQWSGGLLFPDRKWEENHTLAFYEKTPKIRKVELIGDRDKSVKKSIEHIVYKWRDHEGQLPWEATEIAS